LVHGPGLAADRRDSAPRTFAKLRPCAVCLGAAGLSSSALAREPMTYLVQLEDEAVEVDEDGRPTLRALVDALRAPGLLRDQPAFQLLLERRYHQERRRQFRLIQGGRSGSD
jgi:hypothetical protein